MYTEAFVDGVAKELEGAREEGDELLVAEVHAHDLSEFMKTLLQRFTRWFDREHNRRGTERYKSVIVESGAAARTIAACIGLNPVRAGMVNDPVDYRWSSYSEAVGGGAKGNGKKAREELVRACMSLKGVSFEAEKWKEVSRICRRAMGLALGRRSGRAELGVSGHATKNEEEMLSSKDNATVSLDLGMAGILRKRVRYFTDGAVIGSKAFVNEAFAASRERFTEKRRDGSAKNAGQWQGSKRAALEYEGSAGGGVDTQCCARSGGSNRFRGADRVSTGSRKTIDGGK